MLPRLASTSLKVTCLVRRDYLSPFVVGICSAIALGLAWGLMVRSESAAGVAEKGAFGAHAIF